MSKTWPETPKEEEAYNDWRMEVYNGETLRGFRDWLHAGEEEED